MLSVLFGNIVQTAGCTLRLSYIAMDGVSLPCVKTLLGAMGNEWFHSGKIRLQCESMACSECLKINSSGQPACSSPCLGLVLLHRRHYERHVGSF